MHHHVSRVLPYTPEQLFALVGDVARYPEFVPWITSMRVWNEHAEREGVTVPTAEVQVRELVMLGSPSGRGTNGLAAAAADEDVIDEIEEEQEEKKGGRKKQAVAV